MWEDPIVAEIHRIREQLMAKCNNDPQAFFAGVRERQERLGERLVSPKPRDEIKSVGEHAREVASPAAQSPATTNP